MSVATIATGRFTASVLDVVKRPRFPRPSPVVVYLHSGVGAAIDGVEVQGYTFPALDPITTALADAGYTIVAPTLPAGACGNGAGSPSAGTAQARIVDAIAYARASLGCTTAPVVLLSTSMGTAAALRYASLHPTLVACVVSWLSVTDLSTARFQNVGGNAAVISTAYGVANDGTTARGGTPLPADTDPAFSNMVTAASAVPWLGHHSSDDSWWTTGIGNAGAGTPCGDSYATAYATKATPVNVGALGHTNASIAATSLAQVLAFVRSYAPW